MPVAFDLPNRRKLPLQRLVRPAPVPPRGEDPLDVSTPIDYSKLFVPPSLTPLYYTKAYADLAPPHALRYNQLMGMLHNEVIAFFESAFASNVLGALDRGDVPTDLSACLRAFIEEETRHTAMWRRLNRLSAPDWYARTDSRLLRIPGPVKLLLDAMSRRPTLFPMILWVMLIMEERSIEISRRYARMDDAAVEPHYAAAYRWHLEDEVRHVQIDWHLLERVYAACGPALRRVNAALFKQFVLGFFLTPARATVRVLDVLVDEHPDVRPMLPRLAAELRGLRDDVEYRRMMYSDAVNPITFGLMEHFPEFRDMREAMRTGVAAG